MKPRRASPAHPEDAIPPPLTGEHWRCFFLAARTLVDRKTPKLTPLWDKAASVLAKELRHAEEFRHDGLVSTCLGTLLRIMEQPEAAKQPLAWDLELLILESDLLFDLFKHCRNLRRRGPKVRYESWWNPRREEADEKPIQTDSPDLYRRALQEVYGRRCFPDALLTDCHALVSNGKPAEAAYQVLGHLYDRTPDYLMRYISAQRKRLLRKRRATRQARCPTGTPGR